MEKLLANFILWCHLGILWEQAFKHNKTNTHSFKRLGSVKIFKCFWKKSLTKKYKSLKLTKIVLIWSKSQKSDIVEYYHFKLTVLFTAVMANLKQPLLQSSETNYPSEITLISCLDAQVIFLIITVEQLGCLIFFGNNDTFVPPQDSVMWFFSLYLLTKVFIFLFQNNLTDPKLLNDSASVQPFILNFNYTCGLMSVPLY